jgi:hypothetical protein
LFYSGQLQWIVKEKVTDYGQDLTLFCPVGNCCSEPPGWFVGHETIILDVRTFSNERYHGTNDTDGFGVVIRNLSEADLNVTYSCIYGFNIVNKRVSVLVFNAIFVFLYCFYLLSLKTSPCNKYFGVDLLNP